MAYGALACLALWVRLCAWHSFSQILRTSSPPRHRVDRSQQWPCERVERMRMGLRRCDVLVIRQLRDRDGELVGPTGLRAYSAIHASLGRDGSRSQPKYSCSACCSHTQARAHVAWRLEVKRVARWCSSPIAGVALWVAGADDRLGRRLVTSGGEGGGLRVRPRQVRDVVRDDSGVSQLLLHPRHGVVVNAPRRELTSVRHGRL